MAITMNPNVREMPTCVITPPCAASTMIAPHPTNTKMNVAISSAIAFCSREIQGLLRDSDHDLAE